MAWQVGAVANGVIALAYVLISTAIFVPLVRSRQLRLNPLGAATGAIFLTCAVHHGAHSVQLLAPTLGISSEHGEMMRHSWPWTLAAWDVLSAAVGVYYWSLRRTYGELMKGAALFQDLKERQRQAMEINDNIVQGLVVAKMALELDERATSQAALENALSSASSIISDLLGQVDSPTRLGPGDLVRDEAATAAAGSTG
jgi:signal transduction histidine kinase